jgi:three-Cys-motif partner protein
MNQGEFWPDLPATEGKAPLVFKRADYPLWTEHKAKLIARYLFYFVLITKHGVYIDGFAAPQQPDVEGSWSAKLVIDSEPKYLRDFFLCDLPGQRTKYLLDLKAAQPPKPKRNIQVLPGDFNRTVDQVLASGAITDKAATFCLLDQHTFECKWSTLEKLAGHKQTNKIELFYFLATGWLGRAFAGLKDGQPAIDWWGRPDWSDLRGRRGYELAEVFAQRFREELGYTFTYAWPIFSREKGEGAVKYYMIHATDHPEAPKIMNRAYRHVTDAPEPIDQIEFELGYLGRKPLPGGAPGA